MQITAGGTTGKLSLEVVQLENGQIMQISNRYDANGQLIQRKTVTVDNVEDLLITSHKPLS